MIKKILFYFTLFPFLMISMMCSDIEQDPVSFKIISDDTFNGYYIVDGGGINTLENPPIVNSWYLLEKDLDEIDSVEIRANRTDEAFLEIIIYRDDNKVKSTLLDSGDSSNTLLLEYVYGEEEDSNSSD